MEVFQGWRKVKSSTGVGGGGGILNAIAHGSSNAETDFFYFTLNVYPKMFYFLCD